jgi:hypothetical protein
MEIEILQRIEARLEAIETKLETLRVEESAQTAHVDEKTLENAWISKIQSMDPHLILMA